MKSLSMRPVCLLLLIALVMGAFSLTACQKSDPLAENGISSVTVNAAKQTVTVHVPLNTSTLEAHAGQELCLYLLAPDQTISNIDPDSPVKTAKAKGEVRFTLPLVEGEDNRLYAGYAVGFSDGTLLSASPAYVTNPAALSSDKGVFPWSASSKALLMDSSAHATALHTMHTAVSVSWRELTAGEDSFAFFGKTYRYSEPYLRALDKLIADSCGGGAQVSLILSGDALSDHAYSAALLELLTSRYSGGEKGKVTALIINGGSSPSDASRLFRYAYLALRSRVANGRVYVQSNAQTLTDAKIYFTDLRGENSELATEYEVADFLPFCIVGDYFIGSTPKTSSVRPAGDYALNLKTGELKAVPGLSYP